MRLGFDPLSADSEDIEVVFGQIVSSCIPFVDVRDIVGNLVHGDYGFAGLSALGLIPELGDLAKGGGKITKFIVKYSKKVTKITGMLVLVDTHFPELFKVLGKSDEFISAMKNVSKTPVKMTMKMNRQFVEIAAKLGINSYITTTKNLKKFKYYREIVIDSGIWKLGRS